MAEVRTKLTIEDNASSILDRIGKRLDKLNQAFTDSANKTDKVANAVSKADTKAKKLGTTLNRQTKATQSVTGANNKNTRSLNNMNTSMRRATNSSSLLIGKLRMLASTYLGVMGMGALIGSTDDLTNAENKFITQGMQSGMTREEAGMFSESAMDKIYAASKDSYSNYMATADNVAKSITLAGEAFGETLEEQLDNATRFQNVMSKTYALGGASDAEKSSSMYQLVQALGSGKLQGDELRSLTEGAPLAAQAIKDFANKVYGLETAVTSDVNKQEAMGGNPSFNTEDIDELEMALKDLGAKGMLTSDVVVGAVLSMGTEVDQQFDQIDRTFDQLWTNFKSDTTKAFEPFMRRLRAIGNSDDFAFLVDKATEAMFQFANGATNALGAVESALSWIRNNWNTFVNILSIGATLLGAKIAFELGGKFATFGANSFDSINKVITAFGKLSATSKFLLSRLGAFITIALIGVIGLDAMSRASNSLAQQIGILLMMFGAIIGVLMLFGIIGFSVPLLIVAGLLILGGALMKFADKVIGGAAWLGALIVNIASGIINGIIQFIMALIRPIGNVIEWIYNAFNGGFDGLSGAFANLVGNLIDGFLQFGKIATKVIDAVFGTDWTSELNELSDKVRSWGKTEDAVTFDYNDDSQPWRLDLTDAYDWGAEKGNQFMDWQDSKLGEGFDFGFSLDNLFPDPTKGLTDKLNTEYNFEDIGDYTANIDTNTGNMANSMELSEEDLKYLRLLAEKEAINKFTTAEIRVDMTNHNSVSRETDLDGVVTHLARVLREEMVTLADGVHA